MANNYKTKSRFDVRTVLRKDMRIFTDDELNKLVLDSLYEDENDIAKAIMYVNKNKLYFTGSEWYFYDDNRWKKCDKIDNAIGKFTVLFTDIKKFITDSTEMYDVEKKDHIDQITKFVYNIKNSKKNKQIIETIKRKLETKNIFDSNMNLIGFNNGVYDFEKMEFRQVSPSDMVTLSCGYDYCDKYENKQSVLDILSKIFPTDESMEFFLIHVATALCGNNNCKLLPVIQLKNPLYCELLTHLLSSTLGKYCCCVSDLSQFIAKKTKIPIDLSYLKSVRFVVSETIGSVTCDEILKFINFKKLKQKHNKDIEKINVSFSVLCMCENTEDIDEDILENANVTIAKNNKYKDIKFNSNDFFLLLLEYLEKYRKKIAENNRQHDKVEIIDEFEICREFVRDCIKKCEGREKSNDVYKKYTEWSLKKGIKKKFTRQKLFSELKDNIPGILYKKSTKFGKENSSGFIGIVLLENYDPDNDADKKIEERKKKKSPKNLGFVKTPCIGIDGVCPYDNKSRGEKYDNYCSLCFCHLFPEDARVKNIRIKTKEIEVVNYVCTNHDGKWYHDIPFYVNFDGGCCPTKRRIDLYKMINGTMLCIEVDEKQHKYYLEYDEFVRYNELMCDMTCKYIFIRYNPDEFKKGNKKIDVDKKTRLTRLSDEINAQICRIKSDKNTDLLEIIHLFYDEK